MAAFSDYIENALVDWLRGMVLPPVPANFYVALFTDPTQDDGGGTEVSGGSYARVAVAPTMGSWDPAVSGNGHTQNLSPITFPTASADWGTITHVAIYDSAAGGNMILHGPLSVGKPILSGQTFEFAAGDLNIEFS